MLQRNISILTAAVTAIASQTFAPLTTGNAAANVILTIEGESMEGADLWTSIYQTELPGYSGDGFAYLTASPMSFKVTVPDDGLYSVNVRGAQILNQEGRMQTVKVNNFTESYSWKELCRCSSHCSHFILVPRP